LLLTAVNEEAARFLLKPLSHFKAARILLKPLLLCGSLPFLGGQTLVCGVCLRTGQKEVRSGGSAARRAGTDFDCFGQDWPEIKKAALSVGQSEARGDFTKKFRLLVGLATVQQRRAFVGQAIKNANRHLCFFWPFSKTVLLPPNLSFLSLMLYFLYFLCNGNVAVQWQAREDAMRWLVSCQWHRPMAGEEGCGVLVGGIGGASLRGPRA
jgi:hypothetical protein